MADIILYIVWILSDTMRERYPSGCSPWHINNHLMEDGAFHFNLGNGYGLLIVTTSAILCFISGWFLLLLLSIVGLIGHAFYRELITDGHYKRIKDGTETSAQLIDFRADLITRLSGFLAPSIMAVVLIIVWSLT